MQELENDEFIPNHFRNKQISDRTVLEALYHEGELLYRGLTNKEYLDYCFVKGACGQTIPLALTVPVGFLLGCINIISKAIVDSEKDYTLIGIIISAVLQICALFIVLYLLLKGCETIPKIIKNPLLVGRCTTYIFMCLLVAEGVFVVERMIDNSARAYHTSQFWVVFALIIWQKVVQLFIYDYKIRVLIFVFLYIYYAFRISSEEYRWAYNFLKASIYISLELIIIADTELKNYSQYQLENMMHYRNSVVGGEYCEFMNPPVTMMIQQMILENYNNEFPIAVFDYTKELLHISGLMLKNLQINMDNDLTIPETILRKLEIVKVYNKIQNSFDTLNILKKQAQFGSSCGANEKGELLHSLIQGPALQQVRLQQQVNEQPRILNITKEGILEQLLNDLVRGNQNKIQGVLRFITEDEQKFYQFSLIKQENYILLILDDVSQIWRASQDELSSNSFYQSNNQEDMKIILQEVKQIATINNIKLTNEIFNQEFKLAIKEQQLIRCEQGKIDFENLRENLYNKYHNHTQNTSFSVINKLADKSEFQSDLSKIEQLIDILIQNCIKYTKEGFITIILQESKKIDCIELIIEDSGSGMPDQIFKQATLNNIQIANYLAKILGPFTFDQQIKGLVANDGLNIVTENQLGTKISIILRNFSKDRQSSMFDVIENGIYTLIDDQVPTDEINFNQDQIIDQYLKNDDQVRSLRRLKKPIKYQIKQAIIEQQQKEEKQIIQQSSSRKQPKLIGLMKLQESGRMKVTSKMQQLQNDCMCEQILIISSNQSFNEYLRLLKEYNQERIQVVFEQDSLMKLKMKIRETECQGCLGYKQIIINCSNYRFNYEELISKLLSINRWIKISLLQYKNYGERIGQYQYFNMPDRKWLQLLI